MSDDVTFFQYDSSVPGFYIITPQRAFLNEKISYAIYKSDHDDIFHDVIPITENEFYKIQSLMNVNFEKEYTILVKTFIGNYYKTILSNNKFSVKESKVYTKHVIALKDINTKFLKYNLETNSLVYSNDPKHLQVFVVEAYPGQHILYFKHVFSGDSLQKLFHFIENTNENEIGLVTPNAANLKLALQRIGVAHYPNVLWTRIEMNRYGQTPQFVTENQIVLMNAKTSMLLRINNENVELVTRQVALRDQNKLGASLFQFIPNNFDTRSMDSSPEDFLNINYGTKPINVDFNKLAAYFTSFQLKELQSKTSDYCRLSELHIEDGGFKNGTFQYSNPITVNTIIIDVKGQEDNVWETKIKKDLSIIALYTNKNFNLNLPTIIIKENDTKNQEINLKNETQISFGNNSLYNNSVYYFQLKNTLVKGRKYTFTDVPNNINFRLAPNQNDTMSKVDNQFRPFSKPSSSQRNTTYDISFIPTQDYRFIAFTVVNDLQKTELEHALTNNINLDSLKDYCDDDTIHYHIPNHHKIDYCKCYKRQKIYTDIIDNKQGKEKTDALIEQGMIDKIQPICFENECQKDGILKTQEMLKVKCSSSEIALNICSVVIAANENLEASNNLFYLSCCLKDENCRKDVFEDGDNVSLDQLHQLETDDSKLDAFYNEPKIIDKNQSSTTTTTTSSPILTIVVAMIIIILLILSVYFYFFRK